MHISKVKNKEKGEKNQGRQRIEKPRTNQRLTGVIQILQSREGEDEEACSTRQGRHWGDPILGQCDDRLAL